MKRTNTPSSEPQKENLDRLVEELGLDVMRQLYPAYKLTDAAICRRAVEQAEAKLPQSQDI